MSTTYKFCGCKWCKAGRKRKHNKDMIRLTALKFRRKSKQMLKAGKEPDTKISMPYTD